MGGAAVHRNRQNKYHGITRKGVYMYISEINEVIPHMHQNDIKNGEHDVLPTLLLMTVM